MVPLLFCILEDPVITFLSNATEHLLIFDSQTYLTSIFFILESPFLWFSAERNTFRRLTKSSSDWEVNYIPVIGI